MACGVTAEVAERFLAISSGYGSGSGSGSGSGYGSGYGSGSGSGSGSGYGYGYGSGYGDGDGDGYGYGYGDGSGYGDGDGDGYGYGYGDGDGDGYGYGSGSNFGVAAFCGDAVRRVDDVPTLLYHIHGNIAKGAILNGDLTTTPCYIAKNGNLFAHGETLRKAQKALEAKVMKNMPVEERIDKFIAEFKSGQKYPARDFWNWHHTLTGSCEMGRNEFARDHGIDLENDALTPEEFIKLTENAYGREVIRQLKERFGHD